MRLALFQPDIPQNTGAAMRLCACLGVGLDIIEPCGFPWKEKEFKRSAMDYYSAVQLQKHSSWEGFTQNISDSSRLVLMTTKAALPYTLFEFQEGDILLAGCESSGVPDYVHEFCQSRVVIPMKAGLRSLNIVNAASMILGEAQRQVSLND